MLQTARAHERNVLQVHSIGGEVGCTQSNNKRMLYRPGYRVYAIDTNQLCNTYRYMHIAYVEQPSLFEFIERNIVNVKRMAERQLKMQLIQFSSRIWFDYHGTIAKIESHVFVEHENGI